MFNILATKFKQLTKAKDFNGLYVFTTVLQKGSKAHLLENHCQRLKKHALLNGFQEATLQNIQNKVRVLLQQNPTNEFSKTRIELTLIEGSEPLMTLTQTPTVLPSHKDILIVKTIPTQMLANPKERIKSNNYLPFFEKIKSEGYKLFIDNQNDISSGLFENFFLINPKEKTLTTPLISSLVLKGITRDWIIKKSAKLGWEIHEKNISVTEVTSNKTAFFSSSVRGILPISKIDDISLLKNELTNILSRDFNYSILQELEC